jgi:hypothetical protein
MCFLKSAFCSFVAVGFAGFDAGAAFDAAAIAAGADVAVDPVGAFTDAFVVGGDDFWLQAATIASTQRTLRMPGR